MKSLGVAFAVALLGGSGCGDLLDEKSCTAAGCVTGFWVDAVASEGLRDGSYEIQLTLDGRTVACAHPELVAAPQAIGTCSTQDVRSSLVIYNGGAPGTGGANAFSIDIGVTPALVVLRVLHEGQLIGEATYEPTYQTIMPNGPECGPICDTAPPQQLALAFE